MGIIAWLCRRASMSWTPKGAPPDMCARHRSDSALSRTRQSTLTSNWTPASAEGASHAVAGGCTRVARVACGRSWGGDRCLAAALQPGTPTAAQAVKSPVCLVEPVAGRLRLHFRPGYIDEEVDGVLAREVGHCAANGMPCRCASISS